MPNFDTPRKLVAEFLGTAFLLATVVGSGIMAETLSPSNTGVALLANMAATGAILMVLILIFGPISGAHFNPAVTIAFLLRREIAPSLAVAFIAVQVIAAVAGAIIAHVMFEMSLVEASTKVRTGPAQWVAETVATFGLLATILGCVRFRVSAVPYAVGLYISAAYWFTSSTSFANPAVTIARSLTDTFSGIRPDDMPAFIAAQLIGAVLATVIFGWLLSPKPKQDAVENTAS
ncbi:MAG: aquaporin family protein [Rhodospirillaceae bacterium]|nr:aquaporin family protein [Rhodospirillaceae bacterium]|tara:strand:+ start:11286 stop:11984 length:699 start_codon:yes stop_codon:yes gene_type:complete